jgi:hypothetical protein
MKRMEKQSLRNGEKENRLDNNKFVSLDFHVFVLSHGWRTNSSRRNILCYSPLRYRICFVLANQVIKTCRGNTSKDNLYGKSFSGFNHNFLGEIRFSTPISGKKI